MHWQFLNIQNDIFKLTSLIALCIYFLQQIVGFVYGLTEALQAALLLMY